MNRLKPSPRAPASQYFQSLPPKPFTYWGRFLDNGSGAARSAFAVSWDLVQWMGYSVPGVLTGEGSPRLKSVLDLHGGVNWSSAKLEEWYDSPLSGTGEEARGFRCLVENGGMLLCNQCWILCLNQKQVTVVSATWAAAVDANRSLLSTSACKRLSTFEVCSWRTFR